MPSLLTRTYAAEDGPRVRLRLARRSDVGAVLALLGARGVRASDLDVRRLLTYDPTRRIVICAFAPIDGTETLVGAGATDLGPEAEPDTLVAADPRVGRLLLDVLAERARSHGRRVA